MGKEGKGKGRSWGNGAMVDGGIDAPDFRERCGQSMTIDHQHTKFDEDISNNG